MSPEPAVGDAADPRGSTGVVADDLRLLLVDLPAADPDLLGLLARLRRDVTRVVPSTHGLTVALWSDISLPIRITVVDEPFRPADVAATLRVPMDRLSSPYADGDVTYYASRPGAYADLAADLVHALDLPPGLAVLDEPPHRSITGTGVIGSIASSVVNRAIGILIARGVDPTDARTTFRGDGGLTAVHLAEAVDLVASSATRWAYDL